MHGEYSSTSASAKPSLSVIAVIVKTASVGLVVANDVLFARDLYVLCNAMTGMVVRVFYAICRSIMTLCTYSWFYDNIDVPMIFAEYSHSQTQEQT